MTTFVEGSQIIKADKCYHFSDNETINQARKTVLNLAKQKAVALSQSYLESSLQMEDGLISKDVFTSISAASIKKTEIVDQKEYIEQRKINMYLEKR